MRTDAEIHSILMEWGYWKTKTPKPMENRPERLKVFGVEFASKPPGIVWMTPTWEIVQFRDVSEVVELLPGVQKLTIRETYLNPLNGQMEIARRMGIAHTSLIRYQQQSRALVARLMEAMKQARQAA